MDIMSGKDHFSEAVYSFGTIFKNLARVHDWLYWQPDPACKSRVQFGHRRHGLCEVLAIKSLFLADLTVTQ